MPALATSQTILDAIGDTPLIQLEGIWVKCEFMNPSGSVKARFAKYVIEQAEKSGELQPGDTIVEATSGNMGNALAMVAAAKGYSMVVVMPKGFSHERLAISRAFGAEVRMVGDFHLQEAVALAKELGSQPGYFCPRQFENPLNAQENADWLGQEILRQLPPDVTIDAMLQGVGTGGTLVGVGQALREQHNQNVKLVAVEPAESTTIATGQIAKHRIEGISDGFVPDILERARHQLHDVVSVSSDEAIDAMKEVATHYGMFVGPSSGANLVAARRLQQSHPEWKNILTLFCDEGEKYLTEYFPTT